jgi:hypothetical protein
MTLNFSPEACYSNVSCSNLNSEKVHSIFNYKKNGENILLVLKDGLQLLGNSVDWIGLDSPRRKW